MRSGNLKALATTLLGVALGVFSVSSASAQTTTVYTDGDYITASTTQGYLYSTGSWSDGLNWTLGSPASIGGTAIVQIGTLPASGTILLDTGEIGMGIAANTIASLQFNSSLNSLMTGSGVNATTGSLTIFSVNNETLQVNGNITNNSNYDQTLELENLAVGAASTFAGGSGGLTIYNLTVGTPITAVNTVITPGQPFNIQTTGTVSVNATLAFIINASTAGQPPASAFGTIGTVNATGAQIQINPGGFPTGVTASGIYPSAATLAADTGDFFKLTTGNFAGASISTSLPPFPSAVALKWITSLYLKGVLFVEPTAGGNVVNAGAVLPIGNDSEFNAKGSATVNVTLNGGELLTNNNSSTLDTGGTSGTAYTTTNTIAVNTTGGKLAATTGTTATYNGIISNGNGSTGTLTIGDGVNNGSGTVVLAAANTYGGGTTITGGTLQLSGSGTLGATTGGLTISGGTLALSSTGQTVGAVSITGAGTISSTGGTLTGSSYTGSVTTGTATVSAGLAGTGTLTQSGAGTLVLGGSDTYTGATSVSAGTLSLTGTLSATSSVTTGGAGVFSETSSGVISNSATFTQGSSGTSVLGGTNTYTGATSVSAGTLSLTGSLKSSVTTSGTGVFSETGTGGISTGATFTQGSSGTSVLGGANTYTGATTVSAGTLQVTNASGSATGTGTVTVGAGATAATLSGTGTISGLVTTGSKAIIAPGTLGTVGTLHTGSNGLTIGSGTALDFDLSSTNSGAGGSNNDLISMGGGTLTLSGTTTVNFNVTSPQIGTANPYTLISGATTISGFNAANFITAGQGSTAQGLLVPVYSTSGGSVRVTFYDPQTITFPAIGNQTYSGTPVMVTLGATASSGLAVTYTVTTGSSIASITGNTLTLTGPGLVAIKASQAGTEAQANGTFAPATSVTQNIMVSGAPVSLSAWETNNMFTLANGFTAGQLGPTDTAFNDGVPNLLKYLYDIDPAQPMGANDWAALPVAGAFTSNGTQYLTLTFREYGSLSGGSITVGVQTSPDLKTWTTLAQSPAQTLTPGQTPTTTVGDFSLFQVGNDSVTGDPIIEIEAPYSGTRQFIRLNASQP